MFDKLRNRETASAQETEDTGVYPPDLPDSQKRSYLQHLIDGHGMEGLHSAERSEAEAFGLSGERIHYSETDSMGAVFPTDMERRRLLHEADEFLAMPPRHFDE